MNSQELKEQKRKMFVLDTSILMHDPGAILAFQEHEVVVPIKVIDELDGLKSNPRKGQAARDAIKELNKLTDGKDIVSGVQTPAGGLVRVDFDGEDNKALATGLDPNKADHIILSTAVRLKRGCPNRSIILVSKDIGLRLKAKSLNRGLEVQDYRNDKVTVSDDQYDGFKEIPVLDESISLIHTRHGVLDIGTTGVEESLISSLRPNLCCRLIGRTTERIVLALFKKDQGIFRLVPKPPQDKRGVWPRNERQSLAFALSFDPSIKIVTLAGKAGTGKSLMAILAAWKSVITANRHDGLNNTVIKDEKNSGTILDKIVVYRPTQSIGKELGFLPGTLEEKIAPWQRPILDSLNLIMEEEGSSERLEDLIQKRIKILPINHIRGVSDNHAIVIIDDAQNFAPKEMKALITRAGKDTKLIITGDLGQVDTDYLDPESNGFAHVITKFFGKSIHGHLQLIKGERSELAELAADIL